MKKAISLFLALAVIMSLSITAFASETGVGTGSYDTEVTGTYVAGTTGNGTVFSVDIAWTGMSFTYHAAKDPVWDTANHTYSEAVDAYWEGEGTITVTNHSNAKITAASTYAAATGYDAAYMTFSSSKLRIASAETGSAQTGSVAVTPNGSLPADTESKTIGTVTVTIAQAADVTENEVDDLESNIETLNTTVAAADLYDQVSADDLSAMMTANSALSEAQRNFKQGDGTQEALNAAYDTAYSCYCIVKAQVDHAA